MRKEFELLNEIGWFLISKENDSMTESYLTSRKKALLSVVRRIEALKPGGHFKIILETIEK